MRCLRSSIACVLLALIAPAVAHAAIASPYEHPRTGLPPHSPHAQPRHHHRRTEDIPQCTAAQIEASGVAASYDWIIVGAGAAGSILAANLSAAFAPASLLLLESGPRTGNTDNDAIRDPALWLDVLHNSTLEWSVCMLESSPPAHCKHARLLLTLRSPCCCVCSSQGLRLRATGRTRLSIHPSRFRESHRRIGCPQRHGLRAWRARMDGRLGGATRVSWMGL